MVREGYNPSKSGRGLLFTRFRFSSMVIARVNDLFGVFFLVIFFRSALLSKYFLISSAECLYFPFLQISKPSFKLFRQRLLFTAVGFILISVSCFVSGIGIKVHCMNTNDRSCLSDPLIVKLATKVANESDEDR